MSEHAREVFELLKGLKGVSTSQITGEVTTRTKEPDPSLLHAWEPDFQDGYEFKTVGDHKITLDQIWDAYKEGEHILISGPSGCGKSTIAFHMLDRANASIRAKNLKVYHENLKLIKQGKNEDELHPYLELPYKVAHYSCHEASRSEELIGTVTVRINKDGSREPVVVRGSVTEAWTQGETLILEEMDFAPPGVWGECHQFFDGRTKETTIYINGPERIKRHDRFRLIATANTLGRGENQAEFAGTQVLNNAFLNRFTYVIRASWLLPEKEKQLVHMKTGLRYDVIDKMVTAAGQTRKAYEDEVSEHCISTRDLLKWGREQKRHERRLKKMGQDTATMDLDMYWGLVSVPSAVPAFLNGLDDETRDVYGQYLDIR